MKISVVTPSTRNDLLPIVEKCLKRQDFTDFEWIIVSPIEITSVKPDLLLKDPPRASGDFWSLCKGWNKAYAHARGELIVNIQDGIWFSPDVLSKFWFHYQQQPRILVSAIGHQYDQIDERGVPANKVWQDPRAKTSPSFEDVSPADVEMVMCSIPKQALLECGGIDEEYDTCNGAQEKEMCWRLNRMNWDFFVDQTIEYKAIKHPRLSDDWEKVYVGKTTPLFIRHMKELTGETRKLDQENLLKYVNE